jgi:predicted secreted protein
MLSFHLFIFLSLCTFCRSCPQKDTPTELTSTPTDDNTFDMSQSNFIVASESIFFLRIQSNPTTGYSWEMFSPSPLQITACTYTQDISPNSHIVGRGGK